MSQYLVPGFQVKHVGDDYTNTNGLLVPASGGVAAKAVPFSELQSAVQTLETAYGVADNTLSTSINQVQAALSQSISTGDAALATRIDGLNLLTEAQVATLIAAAVAGGVRYKGTAAAGAADPTAALGTSTYAQGDLYRVASSGASAFAVTLSVGDYVLYNGTGWDKIDSTDPSLTSGDATAVVEQVGDNQYRVTISPAFIARVTSLETDLAAETTARTSAVSTINTALALKASQAALDSAIATLNTADTGLQTAITAEASTRATDISGLQSRATSIETVNTNQDAALASEVTARTSADSAEVTNRLAGDATLQSAVDAEVTARAAADSTLTTNLASEATARTNADATLQSAVDAEATARTAADSTLTTALASEVTSRTNADATIQTSLTDARATIVTHGNDITALQTDRIDKPTTASAVSRSILLLDKTEILTNGVYDAATKITRFYVPGFEATVDWQLFTPQEVDAPYEQSASPQIRYYTHANLPATAPSGLSASKSYAEVTLYNSAGRILNNTLKAWCHWMPDLAAVSVLVTGFTSSLLAETASWVSRVRALGGEPTTAAIAAVEAFFTSVKTQDYWSNLKMIQLFCGASTIASAMAPLLHPSNTPATIAGFSSSNYTASGSGAGIQGNSSGYINHNFSLSDYVPGFSAAIGTFSKTSGSYANVYDVGYVASADARFEISMNWLGNFYADAFDSSNGRIYGTSPGELGLVAASRVSATDLRYSLNGVQTAIKTDTAVAIPSSLNAMFSFAGGAGYYCSPRKLALSFAASGMTPTQMSHFSAQANTLVAGM